MFKIYQYFLDGIPDYLARHYWWAYLWPKAVWFFDHQPIINAILFGQYQKLMSLTMQQVQQADTQTTLQLTCVYGELTPHLIKEISPSRLHITDVAEVQLALAQQKSPTHNGLLVSRMNAEYLGYQNNSFSTIVLFFLLHELPTKAREHALSEAIRILQAGGSLIITEYGELPKHHMLYRCFLSRWLLTKFEAFLNGFWHEDLSAELQKHAKKQNKKLIFIFESHVFNGFYRVNHYKIRDIN